MSTRCTDLCIRHLKATSAKASQVSSFTEAVRFAVYVVGVSADDSNSGKLFRSRGLGFQGLLLSRKDERRPSLVLTVRQVECLEESLWDEGLGLVDRCASGAFLFCLYSRSRISDVRKVRGFIVDVVVDGGSAVGFLECGAAIIRQPCRLSSWCINAFGCPRQWGKAGSLGSAIREDI